MKILILCTAVIAALAEPPVNNRYLPPGQGFNSAPSQNYGAPSGGSGFGVQRQTDAVFGGRPSSSYGAPSFNAQSSRPSSQYGAPNSQFGSQAPSSQYGAPGLSQGTLQAPSSQYGAPGANQGQRTPSSQYGAPGFNQGGQRAPSSQYGAPSFNQGGRAPSSQYGAPGLSQGSLQAPSSQYGAPGFGGESGQSRPSQQYGAPGVGNQNGFGAGPDRGYLPPGAGGNGYDDGSNGEPANYSFEYMVKDDASGNNFGHRESRQGDRAEGLYYVLLPDGRKQTVQYEADQNGYKPRISYEDTGLGLGGYDRNSQGGGLGGNYNQGGPY